MEASCPEISARVRKSTPACSNVETKDRRKAYIGIFRPTTPARFFAAVNARLIFFTGSPCQVIQSFAALQHALTSCGQSVFPRRTCRRIRLGNFDKSSCRRWYHAVFGKRDSIFPTDCFHEFCPACFIHGNGRQLSYMWGYLLGYLLGCWIGLSACLGLRGTDIILIKMM